MFRIFKKVWMPLLLVVVIAFGAYAVVRIRDLFGVNPIAVAGDANGDGIAAFNAKHITYEITGSPGGHTDVDYLDQDGQPHRIDAAPLPWSVTIVTTAVDVGQYRRAGQRRYADDWMQSGSGWQRRGRPRSQRIPTVRLLHSEIAMSDAHRKGNRPLVARVVQTVPVRKTAITLGCCCCRNNDVGPRHVHERLPMHDISYILAASQQRALTSGSRCRIRT